MNYEKIGRFIQEKRKEKNLTQKQLAQILGVTDKAVSKWERGLGCPDVSILEPLAHALEASILEILKGKKIETEIKLTETNELIKETITYTKNNIKETINKIITFIIISISLLLIILNIENIISLNKKYKYNLDSENQIIKKNIKQIEDNTKIIIKNKGKYTEEDHKKIIKLLENNIEKIKNIKLINETGIKTYTNNEIYLLLIQEPSDLALIELSRILEKYTKDTTYTEMIINSIYTKMMLETNERNLYEYKLYMINNTNTEKKLYNDPLYIKIKKLKTSISIYLNITEQIKRIGEIYD